MFLKIVFFVAKKKNKCFLYFWMTLIKRSLNCSFALRRFSKYWSNRFVCDVRKKTNFSTNVILYAILIRRFVVFATSMKTNRAMKWTTDKRKINARLTSINIRNDDFEIERFFANSSANATSNCRWKNRFRLNFFSRTCCRLKHKNRNSFSRRSKTWWTSNFQNQRRNRIFNCEAFRQIHQNCRNFHE